MIVAQFFRKKSLQQFQTELAKQQLTRFLSTWDLVLLGIGVVIGTGIFVLTGEIAADKAGPAVCLSFLIAALPAGLAALCYAEMVSMVPSSGSAYSYSLVAFGEGLGFLVGWNLILEYLLGASAVAVGWSGYVCAFVAHVLGYELPAAFTTPTFGWNAEQATLQATGALFNMPAVLIILLITCVLTYGVASSARLNRALVVLKLLVIGVFICFAATSVDIDNWRPFIPTNTGVFGHFGWSGVLQGATLAVFAYLGVDNLSTAVQETKNPQTSLPRAIFITLLICSILYVLVCLVLTGLVPYSALGVPYPMAVGLAAAHLGWLELFVECGAIAGLTSVLLMQLYAQPRIFFVMAHDGLLPSFLTILHPVHRTPHITTWLVGSVCALAAGILPINMLGELTGAGALFAFAMVGIAVTVLRFTQPHAPRSFTVPFGAFAIPLTSAVVSFGFIAISTTATLVRLVIWLLLGLCVYVFYGRRYSKLH